MFCVILIGCQTAHTKHQSESAQEQLDAVGSVAGALTGKELNDAEKRKMMSDLKNDKEAQSAIASISGAMDVRQAGIKYCPVDGKRFSADVQESPEHKVKLKELVE